MNIARAARLGSLSAVLALTVGAAEKLTPEQRIWLTRELSAEFATARRDIPRAKKALPIDTSGKVDEEAWTDALTEYGPAARSGDLVQITKITFENKRLIFEINGGFKGGRKWYDRIQVSGGAGVRTIPVRQVQASPAGTSIALVFPDGVPALEAKEVKQYLAPLFDFEQRSATEQYVKSLPEPFQAAIQEQRAVEGMDQDMVLLALGRPDHKVRETIGGIEVEDWIYGKPPGKVIFVRFERRKVVQVRERYAGLGGTVAPPLPPR